MKKYPIIQLDKVSLQLKTAGVPLHILQSITLSIASGESVSVVGPSGSGKTSLLMVIAGLSSATSGKVVVDGKNITRYSEDALARFRAGRLSIVFQGFHLLASMTALENVAVALELQGVENAFDLASDALAQVGLANRKSHFPSQLSGGEQQRVALARAFVTKPKLLLADEPTGNLDQSTGELVMDLLFKMQKQNNTTLMLITHDKHLANRCERQIEMRDGLLVL